VYDLLRPALFRLDPENAHRLTINALRALAAFAPLRRALARSLAVRAEPVTAFGITFKNRVGLAAGYDKNGAAVPGLAALGFGHIEVGTVTRVAQPGNPKPRVHRVCETRGVINSMGFPNDGVDALLANLRSVRRPDHIVLGINIGKGKETPVERAAEDYVALLRRCAPHADYIAVNISSPNTMNLRQLQARAAIEALLRDVMRERDSLPQRMPVLVKIAPDLTEPELDDAVGAIRDSGADGLIATNTTLARAGQPDYAQTLKGGLSGAPLTEKATQNIARAARLLNGALPIIGVGGILSADDARAKLDAGATLLQLYTGLIYRGPRLVGEIARLNRGRQSADDR
jgi:dihydroorotate dehydrogenase